MQPVDAFLHEIVGSGTVRLVCLHDGSPQRTCHAGHCDVGEQLTYLERIAPATHGAFGGEDAHMTASREASDVLRRRTDDAEHAPSWVKLGQIALLYGAQSFCRGGVAAEYNKMVSHGEELYHRLTGELINHFERARTVRRARIVAQIHVVVCRKELADAVEYGESSVP